MKKFYIENVSSEISCVVYFDFEDSEFADILYHTPYIMRMGNRTISDNEGGAPNLDILKYQATSEFMDTNEDDAEYVREACKIWGFL